MTEPGDTLTTDALVDEALALGEGLGRPLRYAQVNSVPNGSTGGIMTRLHRELLERGVESFACWGRGRDAEDDHGFNFGSKPEFYLDVLQTRLDGRAGFHSKAATCRLLARLDEIDPDVVHLHNLHGYYVNVEMLFGWLAEHRCQVRWTLHDCWAFTGHCAYFTYVKCAQWKSHCAYEEPCRQLSTYPKTLSKRSCARNFEDKRHIFNSIPADRMTLIVPSHWLEGLVRQSFLSNYPVEVRHNVVDRSVFKPTPSDFRERCGIGDRFMILGVASPWTERKGLGDFLRLSNELDENYVIVIVGLTKKQIRSLPRGIIGLERVSSPQELAVIYSAADMFFNPTKEDNYPTVNLEAEACGTLVVTYDVGGSAETTKDPLSLSVAGFGEAREGIVTMALLRSVASSESVTA
ncbi:MULTISPECIES: glycosyltransferase [unclassified Adlercreutzia]|uniref:glycosyltransferase n=1 Tax=unclassified Adlercreutzia TaxID=2636013 RepID=UPI0013ED57B1|nr:MULTISPECIES: glycosyltransferase [unclassified Adlercreutzia]